MESKYDAYFQENRPYKMTIEEMHSRAQKLNGHISEQDFLAYLRNAGDKVRFYAPTEQKEDITIVPILGVVFSSGRTAKSICRLLTEKDGERYTDGMYNPLIEKDNFIDGHWYHAYKLSITPIEFDGCIDSWYVSDFLSHINNGFIEIWEM